MLARNLISAFLLFLIFLTTCTALSISVEENIPAGTQWSASISYSIPSGGELKVYLGDELILSSLDGSGIYTNEKVLSYNVYSNKIIISFAGESEGEKTLEAKIFQGDSLEDSTSIQINFFRPLSYSERDEMNSKLSSMQVTIINQNKTITALQQDLNTKQEELTKLRQANTELITSLNKINTEISSLQESDKTKEEVLTQIGSDLNELTKSKAVENAVFGGLFALGNSQSLSIGMIFLVALIIIAAVAMYANNRKKKLYS